MNAASLGLGFIGAGTNTRLRHLPGFRQLPGIDLVAVSNRSSSSAEAVAREFGIHRVYPHWRQVIEDPDVQAVCIGTWPNLHAEATCAALAAGKHVLSEARMAADVPGARRMLAASRSQPQLVAQIVPAPMSLGCDALIGDFLATGRLGPLLEIKTFFNNATLRDPRATRSWRLEFSKSGINMLTLGIVYEMLQRWLGIEASWVQADAAIFTKERPDADTGEAAEVHLPESLLVAGRYRPPTPELPAPRLQMEFSTVDGLQREGAVLCGRHGTLVIDWNANTLRFLPADPNSAPETLQPPPDQLPGWQVEADFINSIRQGFPVRLTSFDQGLRYMLFTDAVYRSWKNAGLRTPVDLA